MRGRLEGVGDGRIAGEDIPLDEAEGWCSAPAETQATGRCKSHVVTAAGGKAGGLANVR